MHSSATKTAIAGVALITVPALLWFAFGLRSVPASDHATGWWAIAVTATLVVLAAFRWNRILFSSNDPIARLMRQMLIASAVAPVAGDAIAHLGSALGIFDIGTIAPVHVAIVTVVFVAMTLEVGSVIAALDAQRRDALEGVRASETRLRLQVDNMPVASMTCSGDFAIKSWNAAAERVFGWSADEILGRPVTDLVPSEVIDSVKAVQERLLAGEIVLNHVNENRTKDGRAIVCRWSCTPLRDKSGTLTSIVGMAEDITEERRWEAALRQSKERYRQLVDNLPHYIYSVDNENRYTAMNWATARALGLEPRAAIGKTPFDIGIPEDIAAEWIAQFSMTRRTGVTQTIETSGPVNGRDSMVKTITAPIRDDRGAVIGVTGITVDLTEQKTAEAAARRLTRAIEQLDEVMFTTDRDGAITYANPAFERVYGYTRDEVIGKTPRILKSGELTADYYRTLWTDLLRGESTRIECRNRRKDGSLVDVIGTVSPLFEVDGTISGFIAVQQDVTEQKRAAEERREINERLGRLAKMEALGTLAGGIAHDFNNILSIILTHATLIQRQQTDEVKVSRALDTINQAVKRGGSLSRQILTFARRAEMKTESVDTATLLMELASMLRETFPRTVQLTLDIEPSLPFIRADSGQLHQALLNLCVNARDAMPDGGEMKLAAGLIPAGQMKTLSSTGEAADHVCIFVSDSGTGMDEETRARIFEPFFTTKEKGKGTGLGLAVVYGIVQSHGGSIDVESHPGRGTTFRLYFPIGSRDSAVQGYKSTTPQSRGTDSLVIVEDEPELLEAVGRHLRTSGYSVRGASSGAEAISICADDAPDAVIMDLGMPSMSPVDLIARLRERGTFPIIAMTGYVDPEIHARVVKAGVERIVQKPFDVSDLLLTIREVLDANGQ